MSTLITMKIEVLDQDCIVQYLDAHDPAYYVECDICEEQIGDVMYVGNALDHYDAEPVSVHVCIACALTHGVGATIV